MPRNQRPIVPEVHLEPTDPTELRRRKKIAHCDSSPTGAHIFYLTKNEDGVDDGPCKHCHKLHSEVHKKSRRQNKNRKGERKSMANLVTVNDLAKESGVDGRIIRRILRKQFGGGSKKTYGWEKGNPELKKIREAIKNRGTQAEKPAENKGTKSTKKTVEKKSVKKETKGTKKAATKKTATRKPAKVEPVKTPATVDLAATDPAIGAMAAKAKKTNVIVNDHIKKTGKAPTGAEIDAALKTDGK